MMSLPELAFSLVFFSLLGLAYVKGYDFVKKNAPEHRFFEKNDSFLAGFMLYYSIAFSPTQF